MAAPKAKDIGEYIAGFPEETQKALELVRRTIKKAVPEAEEAISYAIPAFNLHKRYLIYFAGFKTHIGIYPAPVSHKEFEKDFAPYKTGRGSVQFPLNQPMPVALIKKIVAFRVKESAEKAGKKTSAKKPAGSK